MNRTFASRQTLFPASKVPADFLWGAALLIWLTAMCWLPDPRPLSAPEWAIQATQSMLSLSETKARLVAAIVLRTLGIGMIGILLSMFLYSVPLKYAAPFVMLVTPVLAMGVKWFNFGYFPTANQLIFIVTVAIFSGLAGLALRRSRAAALSFAALALLLFGWGTATQVPADLERAARATGMHLMDRAEEIQTGDEAFVQLLHMAFAYAEENSHGTDATFANKAAILALGVIMGDDKVGRVGRTTIDPGRKEERDSIRNRVTVHGRGDLPKHFAVSAALTVLADEKRALAVGIAKEISDSNPGGSGFSFVDMVANKAGIRLAVLATQNAEAARLLQIRLLNSANDYRYMPDINDLPEGLSSQAFEADYGGLGGSKTRQLFSEIDQRINGCNGLQISSP